MKWVFLFAFVGFAASIPLERSPMLYDTKLSSYGYQGNSFDIPEYVAYQFSYAQKAGYTPAEVMTYLLERGYPEYVAQYLTEQYEAGLSKPYFQSPYEIFRYFYKQGISDNVRDYISQQIYHVYHPDIKGDLHVPVPFSQYVLHQRNYFNQYEKIFSGAKYAYELLHLVEQHVLNAIQILSTDYYQQSEHRYVYEQLVQGLDFLKHAKEVYETYQSYSEKYIPYYIAQHYAEQTALVHKYLQQAYHYIEGKNIDLPPQFVQELLHAYEAAQKAYQAYEPSFFSKMYHTVIDETPYRSSYYNYGPYSSSYLSGFYSPYKHFYGYSGLYKYPQYSASYKYGPYSSDFYHFGKSSYGYQYQPYSSDFYHFGKSSYGYQYDPYQQSEYGRYNQGSSYTWPYYSSSYFYKPYGEKYGSYGTSGRMSSYTPYEYGSYVPSTYKVWDGAQPFGYHYPLKYGFPYTYSKIAAIAA